MNCYFLRLKKMVCDAPMACKNLGQAKRDLPAAPAVTQDPLYSTVCPTNNTIVQNITLQYCTKWYYAKKLCKNAQTFLHC